MRLRSRAMLGPIVQGLLTVGLGTLIAPAQQPANLPAPAISAATDAKAKALVKPDAGTPAGQPAVQSDTPSSQETGVSNPELVTPEAAPADTAPDAAPLPDDTSTPQGDGSLLEEGTKDNRFAPDQPEAPMTPELDTNKPSRPDPKPELPTVQHVTPSASSTPPATTPAELAASPVPAVSSTPAATPATEVSRQSTPAASAPTADAPQQSTPPADATPQPSTAPKIDQPASTPAPAADAPQQPAAPAAPPSTHEANNSQQSAATTDVAQQSNPATPDQSAPQQNTPAAQANPPADQSAPQPSAPAPDATPAAPQQNAPAAPSNPPAPAPDANAQQPVPPATDAAPAQPAALPAQDNAAPATGQAAPPASDQNVPAPPSNPPAPAPDANAQQPAPPATDAAPAQPAAPPAQDNTTPASGQAAPPASDQNAPAPSSGNSQAPAPAPPAADQNAAPPSNPPADNPASTPSADSGAPAPAPASPDQTLAPNGASDSQAVNPSLPAPQVNAPEPPPASRLDIFGGYTYLRPTGKVGTWSFPAQNTRGYIASGTYYFSRHFGVQGEFSHSEYPLGTTGTSPAPPFVQLGGITDSFYTAEAGAVYRFFLGQRLIPFVHVTGGGAKVAGPKFQPLTWGYGFAGGAGLDILLPKTNDHVAFRLVQADYEHMHSDQGALQQYDLAGGTQDVNALRLSAGLVFRFGEMNPIQPKSLACDATPAEVYAGERVTLAATLRNYKDKLKHPFVFTWILTGGKQLGFGPVIFVDTTGLATGTYHATAHISAKEKGRQFAQCSANFTVKPSPAPTLKCSPDPSTVTPGQVSVITAYAASIPQRQLTYSYTTSEGQINGKDNTADLHTDGLPPGVANITCKVQDDLGQTAVATTEVTIAPPALPPAPHAQPLCTVYFNRDMRRPARVDNEGRACLDDIALTMEHQPDARLVLVGEHSDSEADGQLTAAERAINTRAYLANEKGIDPSRVDVRTSTTPGRQVQTWLLAPGAIFDQPTEGRIDESKIKIHGQQYAHQKMRAPQKGPVGEGVSHPPKN